MPIHVSLLYKVKPAFCLFCLFVADDPLVGSIAQEYLTDREQHDNMARDWTKRSVF
jgi:hypothetical protein